MQRSITIAVAVAALAIPSAAFAETPGGTGYNELYGTAAPGAQCGTSAGSGAFGFFGTYSDYGVHDMRGGADGYQTGLNNSSVCGNRP